MSEKLQIVQLAMEPRASVAEVARAHDVNANQVFKWRRAFEGGGLGAPCAAPFPIRVSASFRAALDSLPTTATRILHRSISTSVARPNPIVSLRIRPELHLFR